MLTVRMGGGAPTAAFSFEPFKLKTVLGGMKKDTGGQVVSATSMFGFFALNGQKVNRFISQIYMCVCYSLYL